MLRAKLNKSWRQHPTKHQLYGHLAGQKQDDQLEHTFSSYVRIRDAALKTYQRRWTIGRSGERESAARHDDHDDDDDDDLLLIN